MKYYLVVGASAGIGRMLAKKLSDEETTIILVARREEKLREVQRELRGKSVVIPCDLCKQSHIEHVFDAISDAGIKLDGMIYCAGVCSTIPVKNVTRGELERAFAVNVFGFYEMCKIFSKPRISQKGASIIGLSSYAALAREAGMSVYAMTKEAMNVQMEVMAKEFVKRKIRINTILPANVMSKMACEDNEWSDEELADVRVKQPLGIIPIENIVDIICFLLSDVAYFITGETIAVSAGYHG